MHMIHSLQDVRRRRYNIQENAQQHQQQQPHTTSLDQSLLTLRNACVLHVIHTQSHTYTHTHLDTEHRCYTRTTRSMSRASCTRVWPQVKATNAQRRNRDARCARDLRCVVVVCVYCSAACVLLGKAV